MLLNSEGEIINVEEVECPSERDVKIEFAVVGIVIILCWLVVIMSCLFN